MPRRPLSTSWRDLTKALLVILLCPWSFSTADAQTPDLPPAHDPLWTIHARGGRVLRWTDFDLSRPGAKWDLNGSVDVVFEPAADGQRGCYRARPLKDGFQMAMSARGIPLSPNHRYVCSLLIQTDFNWRQDQEVNGGVYTRAQGKGVLLHMNGIPDRTRGWQRWELPFTSHASLEGESFPGQARELQGFLYWRPFNVPVGQTLFRIADAALVELPAEPAQPPAPGQGVSFAGSADPLPMKIEQVQNQGDSIVVTTTGAEYEIQPASGRLIARQRIGQPREVGRFRIGASLAGLKVQSRDADRCVLVSEAATLSIGGDSLLLIAPHRELDVRVQSGELASDSWRRLASGHLFLADKAGGLSVHPHIPAGTGQTARCRLESEASLEGTVRAAWDLSPGQRLGVCVFPPRPYPWKESFDSNYALAFPAETYLQSYPSWGRVVKTVLLWNSFYHSGYGMSWGPRYELEDEAEYHRHVKAIHAAGMKAIAYMSPYFYYRNNADAFMTELKRFKEAHNIDGVYYDGIDPQDWLNAYQIMRRTRELFGDGPVILHTTGQTYNGGPPLARSDVMVPVVDTYATATLRGEFLLYDGGADWPYPKFIASQYSLSNCIGILKGDRWKGVAQIQQDLICLRYNGRARALDLPMRPWKQGENTGSTFVDIYHPILMKLKALWQQHGQEPDFYQRYYLPAVQALTAPHLPQ